MKRLVFKFGSPAFSKTDLVLGIILMTAAIVTIFKVSKGSKSPFAYALMLFAVGYAITDFVQFFGDSLRHYEEGLPNP